MKKLTLLAALAAILVGIVGCAGEENATEENATPPATTDGGTTE
jgi:hypothetical protein